MQTTRRKVLAVAAAGLAAGQAQPSTVKYVRFRKGSSAAAYGILDGDTVREIRGDLFGDRKPSGAKHKLSEVKLLYPCTPPGCSPDILVGMFAFRRC